MISGINGNIQGTGTKTESFKSMVPSFLPTLLAPQVKGDGRKDKGQAVPTIKRKFPGYVVYRIKGKAWYISRGNRLGQNVECTDQL